MKAIRTIVATAVIVFALTTVAMAGVQRLGNGADADGGARAQPAAAAATAAPAGQVTLSARQCAALVHAVAGDGARDRTGTARHERATTRTHARDKARSHTSTRASTHPVHGAQGSSSSGSASGGTQHSATHHTTAQTHTQTHDGDARVGTHDGGCD
jgi:hypothetical protein